MAHQRSLTHEQQQLLAVACRRTSVARVAAAMGLGRDVVTRLIAGFTCHAGSVAIALQALPGLPGALGLDHETPAAA